jgi:hypothetical protein
MWEPIIGAASAAQPIPADVTSDEHHATRGTEPRGDLCKVPAAPRRPFAWGNLRRRHELPLPHRR